MIKIDEKILREFIKGTLTSDMAVNINNVSDPSAILTDDSNKNFIPQTKQELVIAFNTLITNTNITDVPKIYKGVVKIIEKLNPEK